MCRMVIAAGRFSPQTVVAGFLSMAQGRCIRHEYCTDRSCLVHMKGWGGVHREKGTLRAYRAPVPCWGDPALGKLRNIESDLLLLHARDTPKDNVSEENTHPFSAFRFGKKWFFCHNGDILEHLGKTREIAGTNDSEEFFHYLLDGYEKAHGHASLAAAVGKLSSLGGLHSFLLTDDVLYFIHAYSGENKEYMQMHWSLSDDALVISSEPFAGFLWKRIPNDIVARISLDSLQVKLVQRVPCK